MKKETALTMIIDNIIQCGFLFPFPIDICSADCFHQPAGFQVVLPSPFGLSTFAPLIITVTEMFSQDNVTYL
jgi:hypothetical protein